MISDEAFLLFIHAKIRDIGLDFMVRMGREKSMSARETPVNCNTIFLENAFIKEKMNSGAHYVFD